MERWAGENSTRVQSFLAGAYHPFYNLKDFYKSGDIRNT